MAYEENLIWLGIALCLSSITYLTLSKRQKETIIKRLLFRGRRASSANTPPRSLSPEKKQPSNALPKASEYVESFPPSRREALAEVMEKLSNDQQEKFGKTLDFDEASFAKSVMAFDDDYRKCDENKYTPTGFSVEEVKALGDFPDYATLSGVDLPEAYAEFDITKAQARPYRPFRWAYHQTMSLTKLETDWWLELESNYVSRIAQRKSLYAEHGESVLQWLPGSELACKELMEMSLQFLCARYPQYFSLSADKKVFHNTLLDIQVNVKDKHPLLVMLDHVPEDFAIMLRNPETGYYHFRAGMICSALGWNVGTKIGMQLHQIHAPIPDYREKMQFSMDRCVSLLLPTLSMYDMLTLIQILHENANLQADPTRQLGPRSRPTPLHAPRRPARKIPRLPGAGAHFGPHPPARRLADSPPAASQCRDRVQLQGFVHARG